MFLFCSLQCFLKTVKDPNNFRREERYLFDGWLFPLCGRMAGKFKGRKEHRACAAHRRTFYPLAPMRHAPRPVRPYALIPSVDRNLKIDIYSAAGRQ